MNRLITHRIALLLLLLIPVLALGSCKKNRSIKPLSQLKREQRQAIDRLIKESSFTVKELSSETLPSTIDPDVFYRLSNGLYIRVLDKGTTRPEANKTTVSVQLKGYFFNVSQSKGAIFDNLTETKCPSSLLPICLMGDQRREDPLQFSQRKVGSMKTSSAKELLSLCRCSATEPSYSSSSPLTSVPHRTILQQ